MTSEAYTKYVENKKTTQSNFGAVKIQRRREWSVDNFNATEI